MKPNAKDVFYDLMARGWIIESWYEGTSINNRRCHVKINSPHDRNNCIQRSSAGTFEDAILQFKSELQNVDL